MVKLLRLFGNYIILLNSYYLRNDRLVQSYSKSMEMFANTDKCANVLICADEKY